MIEFDERVIESYPQSMKKSNERGARELVNAGGKLGATSAWERRDSITGKDHVRRSPKNTGPPPPPPPPPAALSPRSGVFKDSAIGQWLQQRFDCRSTDVRLPFDCNSTALRPFDDLHYDRRPTCVRAAAA